MYRLLTTRTLHNRSPFWLTNTLSPLEPNILILLSKRCIQCNLYNGPIRQQSTRTNTLLQSISKKKKKQKRQKYTELLEVNCGATLMTKASVSNLKAKHLTLLMNQPEITLDELHKLKHLKSTKSKSEAVVKTTIDTFSDNVTCSNNNQKLSVELNSSHTENINLLDSIKEEKLVVDNVLNDHLDGYSEEKIMSDPSLLEIPGVEQGFIEELQKSEELEIQTTNKENAVMKSSKKNKRSKEQIEIVMARDRSAREDTLARLLLGYLGLSISQGKPQKAQITLNYYRQRAKRVESSPRIKDVRIYNCVMEGFAAKGNIGKVRDILSYMNEDSVVRNIQTYLIIFECLGRMKPLPSVRTQLEMYQKEMDLQGFTLNDMMNKGKFINDQREVVFSTIKSLHPNFIPQYTPPNIQYDCALVKSLNHSDQIKFLNSKIDSMQIDNNPSSNTRLYKKRIPLNINEHSNTLMPIISSNLDMDMQQLIHTNTANMNDSNWNYQQEFQNTLDCPDKDVEKSQTKIIDELQLNNSSLKEWSREQLKMEARGYVQIKSIEKETEPSDIVLHLRKQLLETQSSWKCTIIDCIKRDLSNLQSQTGAQGNTKTATTLHACLTALPIDELAQLVVLEAQRLAEGSETFSPAVAMLYRELGSIVHSRYQVRLKIHTGVLNKVGEIYDQYCDWYTENNALLNKKRTVNPRQAWQSLVHINQTGPSVDVENRNWPHTMIVGVGKFLYKIITKDLKVNVNALKLNNRQPKLLPAFYTVFRSQGHVIKEELKAHPTLTKLFRGAAIPYLTFTSNMLPMKCPPRPWISAQAPGGYLVIHTDIIRLPPQATVQTQRLASIPAQCLYPALDSLNQLAAVPWTVNQEILNIAVQVFRNGGSAELDVAQPPSALQFPLPLPPDATKKEKFQAFRKRMAVKRKRAEMYSLWCDALYRFSLANHFKNDIFWLPHNMDFRGRVYPVPPHLTHLGSDLARSILIFAESKPLGPDGLKWLKLHLVNLTGTKKHNSIDERIEYANEVMPEILDSADNPLTGKMWWSKSDEPWQTLACCREIAEAIRSPDPEKHLSRFPVHQDGSCNGLQHYAALGRDTVGAKSVNLTPAPVPQDVYAAVAELVEKQRKLDADAGNTIAALLEGFVKRKVIKQTVMTTVYGVTRFGARLQIARQLKDIDNFPKEHVWSASTYLTACTFESIRTMFTSTREIQDWFTDCARLISGVNGQNVEWITPLGLPVVQPYSRYRKIDFTQKNKTNRIPEHFALDAYERPNVMKQKNAFPPNFIHSLDSSHMMLTSLYCEHAGLTFISVHDCFWTHPINVSVMNKICREQFVALHSQPILKDLSNFLVRKYSYDESELSNNSTLAIQNKRKLNKLLQQLPRTGDFQLDSILDSIYFFS